MTEVVQYLFHFRFGEAESVAEFFGEDVVDADVVEFREYALFRDLCHPCDACHLYITGVFEGGTQDISQECELSPTRVSVGGAGNRTIILIYEDHDSSVMVPRQCRDEQTNRFDEWGFRGCPGRESIGYVGQFFSDILLFEQIVMIPVASEHC